MFLQICSVDLWLYHRAATYRLLGRCSTRIQSALHWFHHSLCSFEKLWSILSCSSKLRWHLDVDGSFQVTIQNLKRRRLSHVEDWWLFRHQLMTDISINVFPNQSFPNLRSHLVLEILLHECRWFHRYSHKYSPNNRMFFSFSCNVGNSLLSFSHLIIHPIHSGFCNWRDCHLGTNEGQ